jgi:WD40 repeat protein
VDRLVASADGKTLCALNKQERRFLDATSGEPLPGPRGVFPPWDWLTDPMVRCSADGKTVIKMRKVGAPAPAGPTLSHTAQVSTPFPVAFSPDGRLVVTGCADGTVRVWGRATGELLHTFRHPRGVMALAVAPGGRWLLVGGGGTARLWDLATKKPVGQSMTHPTDVSAVAFSPDGQVALTGDSGSVQLWEASTALPLGPPLPCRGVRTLAFAPAREAILVSNNIGYRLFPIKRPVPDDVRRLALAAQVLTGLELDEGGAVQILHPAAWDGRRRQLEEAGESLLP